MILADKIINERKKLGWSQEELAEQLSVSRQSISKWEGAQAIPDIQKIIKMADIFGVTTDYLLKDEMEPADIAAPSTTVERIGDAENVIKVSMEEACDYLETEGKIIPRRANMVSLIVAGPAVLILLLGLSVFPGCALTETAATAIGVCALLLFVAIAVFFFIKDGMKTKRFQYLETEPIETMYGVSGMVKERRKADESSIVCKTAIGVIMIIAGVIPLIAVSVLACGGHWILLMTSLLLFIVSFAVNLLVRANSVNGMYERLLQEGDFTRQRKEKSTVIGAFTTVYWLSAWVLFFLWGYLWDGWAYSWLVFPVGGVVYAAIINILGAVSGSKEE
ncbi:MAG: helix-turn-helix transcriptional regulator [Lachnospiraceae bacterium]|nr:helix-turn-helix transcriptional regulator [Lachnospiraceae bacterium]